MPNAVTHPTTQELAAFALGKLPERAAAALAAHLETCAACRTAVACVSADSFLGKVRGAGQDSSSFPQSVARPVQPAIPVVPCPDAPPELARHPRYLILRELGRGGMGVIYQARHREMDRQVVIKVINRALLDRPHSLERFRREIRAAAQLSHPNIVTAYDAEQVGELNMLVMEFVPGHSLAEVMKKKGPLPAAFACNFARQVALGLQHAYECNLVHRDIKPQNLMLTPKGQVKILDFGLAKLVREEGQSTGVTADGAYLGTPDYCAPEQATDAAKADIRADLYSLGCTLYCLLAGRPPFQEDTKMNTLLAHIQKEPQPLPELRPDVPATLWQVVKRLLAKEPAQRYQEPIEVFRALSAFVKPGAKPDAKRSSPRAPAVSSPGKGTKTAADTSQFKKESRKAVGKESPKEVPAKDEAVVSPFADLTGATHSRNEVVEGRARANPSRAAWWKRPGVLAGGVGVCLALILIAVIIIEDKRQTPNVDTGNMVSPKGGKDIPKPPPTEAFVVLKIDQPGAEVLVDGQTIEVHVPGDNKPIEVKVV